MRPPSCEYGQEAPWPTRADRQATAMLMRRALVALSRKRLPICCTDVDASTCFTSFAISGVHGRVFVQAVGDVCTRAINTIVAVPNPDPAFDWRDQVVSVTQETAFAYCGKLHAQGSVLMACASPQAHPCWEGGYTIIGEEACKET